MFLRILQSKWFISISLLVIAIYLFSLVVIKKQGQIAGEELLVIKEYAQGLAGQRDEVDKLNAIYDKAILLEKNSFLLSNTNSLTAIESPELTDSKIVEYFSSYRKFIDDEEWQLFLSMERKSWYDLQLAKPQEFDNKYPYSVVIQNLLQELSVIADSPDRSQFLGRWELFLSYYYSQLVHLEDIQDRKLLFEQSFFGILSILPRLEDAHRTYAYLFIDNSNLLQEELIQAKMSANSQFLLKEKERSLASGIEFLSKIAPLLPNSSFQNYQIVNKNPKWFCSHIRRHRRFFAYLEVAGDEFPLLTEDQLQTNKKLFIEREKVCGDQMEAGQLKNYMERFRISLKLPEQNGAWDLGNKYKAEGIAMKQLIVELSRLYRRHVNHVI